MKQALTFQAAGARFPEVRRMLKACWSRKKIPPTRLLVGGGRKCQAPRYQGLRLQIELYFIGFEWQRSQFVSGKATEVWQTPQNLPARISSMEYLVVPRFPPLKISG